MKRSLAILVLLGACGSPPPPTEAEPISQDRPIEGPIAASVDGQPIALSEVEQVARDTGLSPIDALHRLEQERVLIQLAQQASLGVDAEATSATRRAAVQAMLRARVEEAIGEADITDAQIAARYEASRGSWVRSERRASVHVLAAPGEGASAATTAAAQRFARVAIARLMAAADPSAEAHLIQAEAATGRTFTVTAEDIPATSRSGALEEPYLAALFAIAAAPGVAPQPVQTSYGFHAVALTSIEPAFELTLAEATPILRRQLVVEHRGAALDALTDELASHTTVSIDERVAARAFATDLGAAAP